MPLHGPDKLLARQTDGLGDAILRQGHYLQRRGQFADRLVVQAVHGQLTLAQQLVERPRRHQRDTVYRHIVGRLLVVLRRRGVLGGQVLVQRAAQVDVQKLDAPANAQHWLVLFQGQRQQLCLHGVTRGAGLTAGGRRGRAVQGRGDILAAGQQKSAAGVGQLAQSGVIVGQRQHNGQAARLLHAPHITGQHPVTLPLGIHQRHNSNQRPFHSSHTSL